MQAHQLPDVLLRGRPQCDHSTYAAMELKMKISSILKFMLLGFLWSLNHFKSLKFNAKVVGSVKNPSEVT